MNKLTIFLCLMTTTFTQPIFALEAEEVTCAVTDGVAEPTIKVLNPSGSNKEGSMELKVNGFTLQVSLGKRRIDQMYALTASYVSKATSKKAGKTILASTLSDKLPLHLVLGYQVSDIYGISVGENNNLMVIDCK